MKITLDLPVIEGYEYTGEYRLPLKGEEVAIDHMHTKVGCSDCSVKYFILKKKAPKYKTITPASYLQESGCIDFSAEYVEIKALEDALKLSSGMVMTDNDIAIYKELYSLLN
tara:strand:+ start:344 stop:679 length:336 start_codon:yes stop_codon:yes gene_type:complete